MAVAELLQEKYKGWDPVLAMAEVAQDKKQEMGVRVQCMKEVAKYRHPALRQVDHTTKGEKLPTFHQGPTSKDA